MAKIMTNSYLQSRAKRIFDILLSAMLLVIFLPLISLGVIIVLFSSPGPPIYCALRIGKNGKQFIMFKLRTMHLNNSNSSCITAPEDVRVYPAGKFLRALKIDEFPQLFNILIGDMSFVGPRPEAPSIVNSFYLPWMSETLSISPGLTGIGSIFGYIHGEHYLDSADIETSYANNVLTLKLALEHDYVCNANFLIDLYLIIMTPLVVLSTTFNMSLRLRYFSLNRAQTLLNAFN